MLKATQRLRSLVKIKRRGSREKTMHTETEKERVRDRWRKEEEEKEVFIELKTIIKIDHSY